MLPVAGLQRLSLVDYPNHLCAIVFLQGCNLRCPFCHNVALIPCEYEPEEVYKERWEEVLDYLSHRKTFLEGVCITGGEPTLHADLPNAIHQIKSLGYKVKLDTNGTNPGMLELLLREGQLDYVAMDVKTRLERYTELGLTTPDGIDRIRKSISLIISIAPDYEFRTTVVPGFVEEEDIRAIAKEISSARRYVLQAYRSEYVFDPEHCPDWVHPPEKIRRFVELSRDAVGEVLVRGYGDSAVLGLKCC